MLGVKIIKVVRIIFGQYTTVTSSRKISVLLRFYCLCSFVFVLYFIIGYLEYLVQIDEKGLLFNAIILTNYIISIILSLCSKPCIHTFTDLISSCDYYMGYTKNAFGFNKTIYKFLLLHLSIAVLSVAGDLQLSKFWMKAISSDTMCWMYLLVHHYIHLSLVASYLDTIIIIELLRNRFSLLRDTLHANAVPVNVSGRDEIQIKINRLRKCLRYYIDLLNAFGKIYGWLQLRMFILFAFTLPHLTIFTYSIVQQLWFEPFQKYMSRFYYADFFELLVIMTAPCVICELCSNEVNLLKVLLTEQIIHCDEEELRKELLRSLTYVSRRPFSLTVLNMNVGVGLPLQVIAFSITYVILIIDYTHFVL